MPINMIRRSIIEHVGEGVLRLLAASMTVRTAEFVKAPADMLTWSRPHSGLQQRMQMGWHVADCGAATQ